MKTQIENIMKKAYKVGDKVELNNGLKGTVISVCSYGNGDIRPPYHLSGVPNIKADKPHVGYVKIIPDSMKIMYAGEVNEKDIVKVN